MKASLQLLYRETIGGDKKHLNQSRDPQYKEFYQPYSNSSYLMFVC